MSKLHSDSTHELMPPDVAAKAVALFLAGNSATRVIFLLNEDGRHRYKIDDVSRAIRARLSAAETARPEAEESQSAPQTTVHCTDMKTRTSRNCVTAIRDALRDARVFVDDEYQTRLTCFFPNPTDDEHGYVAQARTTLTSINTALDHIDEHPCSGCDETLSNLSNERQVQP